MIRFIGKLTQFGRKLSFNLLPASLISFLIVGSLGVGVHLAVLKSTLALITHQFMYANLTALVFAATFNYVLNNESTFSHNGLTGRHAILGYFIYMGVTSLGMVISLYISTHVYSYGLTPVPAALCGIVAGSMWNYFMSYTFVWKLLFKSSAQKVDTTIANK
ncbi:GtrA family protein [Dyella caseinilytica]|uniref:GtrA family protein n=1 Tax=Dyella caseinilytica TaxID=1849581 RepID=A0ABX7GV39_9GAMM|nr:GtrA family protein [Dyella caseinilytica]QRN53075.1 GtrA family protein [Dyella caseinilytica]GGA11248.1 GtrA-like protein [Dyella caseinilytica]